MGENKKVKIVVNGKVIKVVNLASDEWLEEAEFAPSIIANAIANSYGHRGGWEGAITKRVIKRKKGKEKGEIINGIEVVSTDILELIEVD